MDECDFGFRYSDEVSEVVHYLNCRADSVPISRVDPNDVSKSVTFENFGLTIVTQRRSWLDDGTENRTISFLCEKTMKPIPTVVLDEWIQRGLDLQDRLLYLRMAHYRDIHIDKKARIDGVKDDRLTASLLPAFALRDYAPEMTADLKQALASVQQRRREVKSESLDGHIVNVLWDAVQDGRVSRQDGRLYFTTKVKVPDERGEAKDEVVPMSTHDLAERLHWEKPGSLRRIIIGLGLVAGKPPPPQIMVGSVRYRPIWFSVDRLELRLQDFVADYKGGVLAARLKELGLLIHGTEQPKGVLDYGGSSSDEGEAGG